ncbi:MAG: 16S rRNA (cytosine(967)-C(5))-methyltransferase [Synechococcales bacterium]|nr:16S rRNA (cytosine(967)-C(5))-methyltransferase [Synechococcales bacterium]
MTLNSRQVALDILQLVQRGKFADVALHEQLGQTDLDQRDRSLVTELVYGTVRRQRTLDALIDQFAKKGAASQPLNLRLILRLGFYQLRYLTQIPAAAAVNTAVDLAKRNGLKGLSGVVNGILRQYLRLRDGDIDRERSNSGAEDREEFLDPLELPEDSVKRLGVQHSYPDWIIQTWIEQVGLSQTEALCQWFNQSPHLDLRINPLKTSVDQVAAALGAAGLATQRIVHCPQSLRLVGNPGRIQVLPGFEAGWWTVQEASAQMVSYVLAPQPGETIVDACAAPGGKTTHIAELMGDRGKIWACDRSAARLQKLTESIGRLGLQSIQPLAQDSRTLDQFHQSADRVLIDAPCSGLGTLHRHVDARWRQSLEAIAGLTQIQRELLTQAAQWVKPDGVMVYATCTLHPAENEEIVRWFLAEHPDWVIERPNPPTFVEPFIQPEGWLQVWPQVWNMDGFFMVRLKKVSTSRK